MKKTIIAVLILFAVSIPSHALKTIVSDESSRIVPSRSQFGNEECVKEENNYYNVTPAVESCEEPRTEQRTENAVYTQPKEEKRIVTPELVNYINENIRTDVFGELFEPDLDVEETVESEPVPEVETVHTKTYPVINVNKPVKLYTPKTVREASDYKIKDDAKEKE